MSFVIESAIAPRQSLPASPPSGPPAHGAPEVWSAFVRDAWEKATVTLPAAMRGPLVGEEVLLRALVAAAEATRTTADGEDPFVLWVGGKKTDRDDALYPSTTDTSLRAYLGRVERAVGGQEFTLLLANPHLHSHEIRAALAGVLDGLLPHSGMPCGGIDSGIFLGRYGKTPFGVHRGQMSVLTFPVLGTKRFLLWERGYGEAHEDIRDSLSYDKHMPTAIERTASAGDVLYWPADYWHIADGEIDCTAALNVGFWWDKPPLQRVLTAMTELLADRLAGEPETGEPATTAESPAVCFALGKPGATEIALPGQLARLSSKVSQALSDAGLESTLQASWLAMRSARGLRDLSPLAKLVPMEHTMTLERRDCALVLSDVLPDGRLCVAAEGHLLILPNDPAVAIPLLALQTGAPAEFMLDETPNPEERAMIGRLANFLLSAEAAQLAP